MKIAFCAASVRVSSLKTITQYSVVAALSLCCAGVASAADLPVIKAGAGNPVPGCATPGRLMAFLKARNSHLDDRFGEIATQYMRHGEALGLRWDIAYYQMLLETGNLTFTGAVKPKQNNFAGLGATGGSEPGESFPDISTGVRAHLEHVAMYSGEKLDNPVAERTRKVQEWGVLTSWQKSIKGPMTYAQLAQHWAPKSRHYVSDIEQVAESFIDGPCKAPDPNPGLVAQARAGSPAVKTAAVESPASPSSAVAAAPATEAGSMGALLAKRALEEAKASGTSTRSSLGAGVPEQTPPAGTTSAPAYTLLNGAPPSASATPLADANAAEAQPKTAQPFKVAAAADAVRVAGAPAATGTGKCRVWTASYGGSKAMIIKAVTSESVNYTVLDVHEGSEKREAEAYIAAYAKGGQLLEDFASEPQALEKAFQLCPEG